MDENSKLKNLNKKIMANWCFNRVTFSGSAQAIEQVNNLFKAMAAKEKAEVCGQLPDYIDLPTDEAWGSEYFFEIKQEDNEDNNGCIFHYATKWSPNFEIVLEIADRYRLDFIQEYEELGCLLFGKAIYTNGVFNNIGLEDEDFQKYSYEEATGHWLFENESYENEQDILRILLDRKTADQTAQH